MSTMLEKIGWYVKKNIDTVFQGLFDSNNLLENALIMETTEVNTVISPDFLVWKLCGDCAFRKTSTPGNQVKLRYFSQWTQKRIQNPVKDLRWRAFRKKKRSDFSR